MKVWHVVGARPNFMKLSPVVRELRRRDRHVVLVHTGQHYDSAMSAVFFEELGLPPPDVNLEVGSGSHAEQTARGLVAFERVCEEVRPSIVVVGGDVNSTLACALAAAKLQIPVAHVEAGLRSFDRSMPEELNRVLTDHLADLLFTTEPSANENLAAEGIADAKVRYVGNCMIDSLRAHLERAVAREPWQRFGLEPAGYGLVTLHRPSNVDDERRFSEIATVLGRIARRLPLLFPVHPRTIQRAAASGIVLDGVSVVEPLGYLDFLGLMARARLVLTDSGGIQEETTALGVPCLTLRDNTERPVTIHEGTNRLVGVRAETVLAAVDETLAGGGSAGSVPALWDGRAAERVVDALDRFLEQRQGATE